MCYGQKRKGGEGKERVYDVRKGGYAHNGMAELHINKLYITHNESTSHFNVGETL